MYLSPVPFDTLREAFPDVGNESAPELSETVATYGTPLALLGVAGVLAGVYRFTKRREEQMAKSRGKGKEA
jgi:hypothetical protein